MRRPYTTSTVLHANPHALCVCVCMYIYIYIYIYTHLHLTDCAVIMDVG